MCEIPTSSGRSFMVSLLIIGSLVWLLRHMLTDSHNPVSEPAEEVQTSTSKAAVDFSQKKGDAMNSSMSTQLKSVREMVGGDFDGSTYVLPKGQK